ncbi:MAG: DUF4019 domain-containing protein [Novosphingobium sp.]|uniref:DUF4019 domain-containing protein n=1 Tax=Novosphingobium sp. TaxID=1874826 RepID=UPI003B9AC565
MIPNYEALTEKEKETLRLLVGGHDAKSIARHLQLSVHTIHERLREARRKMGTASSREAARILHEIEGKHPELLGDKLLGEAFGQTSAQHAGQPIESGKTLPLIGWMIGGLAMTMSLSLLAYLALSSAAPTSAFPDATPTAVTPSSTSEAAAIAAARSFLAKVDQDDWAGSWQATHRSFKLLNTVEWWTQASRNVREKVGEPISRELATVNFTAAPPKGYWVVSFKAHYNKQDSAAEILQMAFEDGEWKVTGITVE